MIKVSLGVVGAVLGGFVGFLLRPAVSLVGQLPFGAVISRGSNLQGFDEILIPVARQSFNIVAAGIIVGALLGAAGGYLVSYLQVSKGNNI